MKLATRTENDYFLLISHYNVMGCTNKLWEALLAYRRRKVQWNEAQSITSGGLLFKYIFIQKPAFLLFTKQTLLHAVG